MRKKMERLAEKIEGIYVTENPINYGRFAGDGCKYFIVFDGTHNVYNAFMTQAECVEALEDIAKNGIIIN